jgi:hypothetical protein
VSVGADAPSFRHNGAMRVIAAVVLVSLAGCGGGGSGSPACAPPLVGSCTSHTGFFCTEYAGVPTPGPEALMSRCKGDPDAKDIWSASGCDQSGALGACMRMEAGLCVAVWLKTPGDASIKAQAQSMCAAQGGTWVEP